MYVVIKRKRGTTSMPIGVSSNLFEYYITKSIYTISAQMFASTLFYIVSLFIYLFYFFCIYYIFLLFYFSLFVSFSPNNRKGCSQQ